MGDEAHFLFQLTTTATGTFGIFASVPNRAKLVQLRAGGARSAAETSGSRSRCVTVTTKTAAMELRG